LDGKESKAEREPPYDVPHLERLPLGTPYGIVGTSSFYKRESFPGYAVPWSDTFDGLDAFNTSENEQSSNWSWQGSDAGKYSNDDIFAVRIVAMEPNTHRSYGPHSGQHFVSHANERLRILGIPEATIRRIETQRKTVDLAVRLAESAPAPVKVVNIGGGFGIPYFPGERALDLPRIGAELHALMPSVRERLPGAELVIELGRYLVGEAGIYVCRVVDKKVSRGETFLVTDGGLHHHLAASGNFGQVIRKNYPVCVGNRLNPEEPRRLASIVGPLCTPLDLLADRVELPDAEPGDLVVVFQSGAYGASASPQGFLSHAGCVEILV